MYRTTTIVNGRPTVVVGPALALFASVVPGGHPPAAEARVGSLRTSAPATFVVGRV